MARLTAAQMTAELPFNAPIRNTPRRLSRRERRLLCRLIDIAWGYDELHLSNQELCQLAAIQKKLAPIRRRRVC